MKQRDPLEELLIQLQQMLIKIRNHKGPIEPPSIEILAKLKALEIIAQGMKEARRRGLQNAHIDVQALKNQFIQTLMKTHQHKSKEDRLLEGALQAEREAKALKSRFIEQTKSPTLPNKKEMLDKQQRKERKKKFKPIGGDRGWIPL